MIQELEAIREKYRQLTGSLSDAASLGNPQKLRDISKERAELEPVVRKFEEYLKILKGLDDARHLLTDPETGPELRQMAESEIALLEGKKSSLESDLRVMLLPKDPYADKNVILEIRAGAGGDEASLFAQDLLRMYSRFAEANGWKIEIMDTSFSPIGGIKEVTVNVRGKGAYSRMKYESGVHRVQRVPRTEASGRIHTSTATVAVLAEADEIDIKLDPKDLRIEAFGASGPGGQSVNRNYTAIRVSHKPSGLVVSCQDEKSQHRNKEKALRVLRSRLMDIAQGKQQDRIAKDRRSQVGTGERSEKIRTYNFPQSRITDHRMNVSFHNLEAVLDGNLDEIVDSLIEKVQAEALGGLNRPPGQAGEVGTKNT